MRSKGVAAAQIIALDLRREEHVGTTAVGGVHPGQVVATVCDTRTFICNVAEQASEGLYGERPDPVAGADDRPFIRDREVAAPTPWPSPGNRMVAPSTLDAAPVPVLSDHPHRSVLGERSDDRQMPMEDLGMLSVVVGVPFRFRQASEPDPSVRVCTAEHVPSWLLRPVLIPRAGESSRPLAHFAAAERGPAVYRAAQDPGVEG